MGTRIALPGAMNIHSNLSIRILWAVLAALGACSALDPAAPDGGGTNPTPDAPAQQQSGWRAIALPADQEAARVTGIACTSRDACVIATDLAGGDGKVLAASDHAVGPVLVDGADVAQPAHVLGYIGFIGLERTRLGLTARVDASGAYVSGTGDLGKPASWSIVAMGKADGDVLPLNAQESLQEGADGHWLFVNRRGFVYESTGAPAPGASWTRLWSPTAVPSVPADFDAMRAADPTLCDSDVSTSRAPAATQNVYVSQDLGLVVHPAGGLNEEGSARPGVCVSVDRGRTFHEVPFAGLPDVTTPGPIAVTCLDGNRCFAYNGLYAQDGSAYLYHA
jgi:hypothetical protein